ncbi:MAG: TadE family protein [Pseudomonadota bacterium]
MTPSFKKLRTRLASSTAFAKELARDNSALAMVEFAFTLPIILALGMLGAETANYVVTHMKISQVAMQVADSASRAGEQGVLAEQQLFEEDVNDVFIGAERLGDRFDIMGRGRIILSSLQTYDPDPSDTVEEWNQEIRWQRCRGAKNHVSSYGVAGDGSTDDTFPGMGEAGSEITASPGTAVMFVEISYTYRALTPFDFLDGREIDYTAAFNVRNNRDLRQIYNNTPPDPVANCAVFSAT